LIFALHFRPGTVADVGDAFYTDMKDKSLNCEASGLTFGALISAGRER